MKKTVLITGTSSGIGKAAVIEFAKNGWNVIATQRTPERENDFRNLSNVTLMQLDVTVKESVGKAFEQVKSGFGAVDVVVNNAGYGVDGVFEAMSDDVIEKQFNTNVFGLMRVTREAIRMMRPQGGGTIIQISSMGGKITFPLYSIYHSTKFAVEGFTESLHYELSALKIKLKLIEPGLIATEFAGRSREYIKADYTNAYDEFITKFNRAAANALKDAVPADLVAREIYNAATDGRSKLRYPVGAPAPLMLRLRKLLPDNAFIQMIKKAYKL